MSLVEAAVFYSYPAAEIARGRLTAEGIGSVVFDGAMSAYTAGGLIPVRLMVAEEDLPDAQAALEESGPDRHPSAGWGRST